MRESITTHLSFDARFGAAFSVFFSVLLYVYLVDLSLYCSKLSATTAAKAAATAATTATAATKATAQRVANSKSQILHSFRKSVCLSVCSIIVNYFRNEVRLASYLVFLAFFAIIVLLIAIAVREVSVYPIVLDQCFLPHGTLGQHITMWRQP